MKKGSNHMKNVFDLGLLSKWKLDIIPKHSLDIEANFDLRHLVNLTTGSFQPNNYQECAADRNLGHALAEWERKSSYYSYPSPTDTTNVSNGIAHTNAELRSKLDTDSLWRMQPGDKQDGLTNFKRNRLLWIEAVQSAWMNTQNGTMDSFYLVGHSDKRVGTSSSRIGLGIGGGASTDISSSEDKRSTTPPVAAVVLSA